MKKITIADVTLRASALESSAALSFREKLEAAKLLDKLGVDIIEAAPIRDEKVDTLVLRTLCPLLNTSILSCPTGLTVEGVHTAWDAIRNAVRPRLLVSAPVSAVQMEYICRKKPAKMLETVAAIVKEAASLCGDVEFAAEDATRCDPAFLRDIITAALDAGAGTVTLCDTCGTMLPYEFAALVKDVLDAVPALKNAVLSVECSNAMDMASACAFACIREGALQIKTSIGSKGSPATDVMAKAIAVKGASEDISCGINTMALSQIIPEITRMTTVGTSSVFSAAAPAFSRSGSTILDKNASAADVGRAVSDLGYDLGEEDLMKVYDAFQEVAATKKVDARVLDSIIAECAIQVPPTFKVHTYVINSGNTITSTANIVLEKNGTFLQGVDVGDGPIDAALRTLEQIIGYHYELDDMQIRSDAPGRGALGTTLVKIRYEGKLYSGKSTSNSIIGATIYAYINAINKIVYEEK